MSSHDLALLDKAIAAVEAIDGSRGGSLKSVIDLLCQLLARVDSSISQFLQKHLALFVDRGPADHDTEIDEIVKEFLGDMHSHPMEQPEVDLDSLGEFNQAQITGMKRFCLFMLFCLKLSITIGITGGAWNTTRQAIGGTITTGRGQAGALASGALAAISLETVGMGIRQFETWLNATPVFEGEDVPAITEMVKIFLTNLIGATTWFGVLQIPQSKPELAPYVYFGLFGMAFFFVGGINGLGELAVGRQISTATFPEEERRGMQSALRQLTVRLTDRKAGAQMLLNFLAWYSYWDYAEGFKLMARNKGHEQAILWGSLVIFFQFAGFGTYGIEKVFAPRRVSEAEEA